MQSVKEVGLDSRSSQPYFTDENYSSCSFRQRAQT
jgi:hypothetical protein